MQLQNFKNTVRIIEKAKIRFWVEEHDAFFRKCVVNKLSENIGKMFENYLSEMLRSEMFRIFQISTTAFQRWYKHLLNTNCDIRCQQNKKQGDSPATKTTNSNILKYLSIQGRLRVRNTMQGRCYINPTLP